MANYYSSVNCIVFLNTNRVYDFYSVEYSKSESVMPVYSWRSQRFDDIAKGQILVTGNLILNISKPRQLLQVLGGKIEDTNVETDLAIIRKEIDSVVDLTRKKFDEINQRSSELELTEAALKNRNDSQIAILEVARMKLEHMKISGDIRMGGTGSLETLDRDVLLSRSYNMEIKNNKNNEVNSIKGIRFTGEANQVQAGSSQNIKYAFPFIAWDVS